MFEKLSHLQNIRQGRGSLRSTAGYETASWSKLPFPKKKETQISISLFFLGISHIVFSFQHYFVKIGYSSLNA